MPALRPARCSTALIPRQKAPVIIVTGTIPSINSPSSTLIKRHMSASSHHAHEDPYDPPSGWLFGVPPGEKAKKEGWENIWYWGFFGGLGLAAVGWAYKPDTSIQAWALEEARRRLEAEGILPPPAETRKSK